jgi:uncharacterized OB-fold protein
MDIIDLSKKETLNEADMFDVFMIAHEQGFLGGKKTKCGVLLSPKAYWCATNFYRIIDDSYLVGAYSLVLILDEKR